VQYTTQVRKQASALKAAASCRAPYALTPYLCRFALFEVAMATENFFALFLLPIVSFEGAIYPYAVFMSLCGIKAASGDRKLFRHISAANCVFRRRDLEMMRELAPALAAAACCRRV
jgi:hypothetical protein